MNRNLKTTFFVIVSIVLLSFIPPDKKENLLTWEI